MSNDVKDKESTVVKSSAPNMVSPAKTDASKIVKAKDTMSLLATSIPVIGFIGTVAVWAATNYYVGEVEVATEKPFTTLTVKAFDKKGQESTFHTPRFQLMPGAYHLEVQTDNGKPQHVDATVVFQKVATVAVNTSEDNDQSSNTGTDSDSQSAENISAENQKKRRWWQIWRRSEN